MSKTEIVTPETQRPVLVGSDPAQDGADQTVYRVVKVAVDGSVIFNRPLPEDAIRRLGLDAYGAV